MENLKQHAEMYVKNGLSVLPIKKKRPSIEWKHLKETLPTEEEINTWDADKSNTGLALIITKGVIVLDFDDMGTYDKWFASYGKEYIGTYRLASQQTGKGMHIAFRTDPKSELARKQALASRQESGTTKILIEIPACALVAPSKHFNVNGEYDTDYKALIGTNFYNLPLLKEDLAKEIIDTCRKFNLIQKKQVKVEGKGKEATDFIRRYVHETFNKYYKIGTILINNGFTQSPYDENKYRPPESTSPPETYGVEIFEEDYCYCHHTNCVLYEEGKKRDAFDCFRLLEHGGDWGEALRAAEELVGVGFSIKNNEEKEKSLPSIITFDLLEAKFEPLTWVIPDLLPEGLCILAGSPKVGKSWFCYDLCISIAQGTAFLNYDIEKGRAIYLSLEDSARRMQTRLQKLLPGEKKVPELLILGAADSLKPLDDGGLEQLENFCNTYPDTKLIVIDTLQKARAHLRDKTKSTHTQNSYELDVNFLSPVQKIALAKGVCILLVTHLSQAPTDDPLSKISGSSGLSGTADTILMLSKKRTQLGAFLFATGREIEEREIPIQFNKETFKWNLDTAIKDNGLIDMDKVKADTRTRIIALLDSYRGTTLTSSAIAEELEMKQSTIVMQLKKLELEGTVKNPKYGQWVIGV